MKIKDEIQALLNTDISTSKIAKDSGVSQPAITYLRHGQRSIDRLSVDTAQKLLDYWEQVKRSTLQK
ncbi:helix-turn-helix domain-containing protein [Levilactobacillus brevis]|uniref:XRE family transcriptional regulator n=1 Tax=Levilactobacillus brevis TaxID=1580 RepID=UPI0011189E35|nr:XRE family transcriptional regulator [Levilactobacillus brevis]QCZ50921.1 Hypothetical protein SAC12_1347 [Levilactobacillus brevis]QCZ50974.1 Hypothetical protein SAC12_1401 [Levilactobacillus brevis]